MRAYVLSEVRFVDEALAAEYRELAAASIAAHGGRYVIRAGALEVVEGDWDDRAVVLVEFDSLEHAHRWYASDEYAPALEIRRRALDRRLLFIEGV